MNLKVFWNSPAPYLIVIAFLLSGCASPQSHRAAFPQPALMLHQPNEILSPRLKDAKSFARFVREIQSECDSYYSKAKPRNPQTVDVVVIIKPGKKSRFWLAYDQPQRDAAPDKRLLQRLQKLSVPPIEEGPVSFSMRLLLWGAREPDPQTPRGLFLPQEWHDAIGTNQNVVMPDGIMPRVWPD
jgi:hypothetical protein